MMRIKLNRTAIEKIPLLESGQKLYWDADLKGFGLRVTHGSKSFIVQKRINGKPARVTIGSYPQLTPEKARMEGLLNLSSMSVGINPTDEKREARVQQITLGEAFDDYKATRKNLKEKTVAEYTSLMNNCFKDWLKKPITDITKDMVEKRHGFLGTKRGKAYANGAMRVLRAVFNFSISKYEDSKGRAIIHENPVSRLSQVRAWYKIKRRDDYLKPSELPVFFKVVNGFESETMRDYFLLLLFTGLRRNEAANLTWDRVNFKERAFTLEETKNGEKLVLPMSDFVEGLLLRRYNSRLNEYVFGGTSSTGHLVEPKHQLTNLRDALGTNITIHGLRRTFITIAESLDISSYAIKRLVNHKMNGDVTAGYIIHDVERLRRPMQAITDYILSSLTTIPITPTGETSRALDSLRIVASVG